MANNNTTASNDKHVMFSYQWDIQELVSKIYESLKSRNIPVWMDVNGGMKTNLYEGMALAVEAAAVVICFMTPQYQSNHFCQKELKYAADRRIPIIPCLMTPNWQQSDWLGLITAGLIWLDFRDVSATNLDKKLERLMNFIDILAGDTLKMNREIIIVPPIINDSIAAPETIRMILLGRSGSGKSSLGNMILGEKQFDICVSSHSAISDQCKVGFRSLHETKKNLIVIDTPGFENNEEEIGRSVQVTISGESHVILLVLEIDRGLTGEEEKMINLLIKTYGKIVFKYFIIIFTGLDRIVEEIDSFINQQATPALKSLIEQCDHRYIGVNNKGNREGNDVFVANLMEIISKMDIRNENGSEREAFQSGSYDKAITNFRKKVQ